MIRVSDRFHTEKRVGLKQKNKIKAEGKAENEGEKETDSGFNNYLEPTRAQILNP